MHIASYVHEIIITFADKVPRKLVISSDGFWN
jgi:hypothetical protein